MSMIKQTGGVGFTTGGEPSQALSNNSGLMVTCKGVSTCLWRGIHIRDVLIASGLQDQPDHERWYLHIEGNMICIVVGDLSPKAFALQTYYIGADECTEGRYATSIPLMHAMDPCNDVLLAFGQNGRVLHPDHGYVSSRSLHIEGLILLTKIL